MPESQAGSQSQSGASSDTKSRVAFLRHPLVVGATIAVISAFFASLLIPSITQVTQDRPKELELKRGIVERIAGATGTALGKGRAIVSGDAPQPRTVYRQAITDWGVDAAAIDGEITTYFGRGDTWQSWMTLHEGTKRFLELTSADVAQTTRNDNEKYLCSQPFLAQVGNPVRLAKLRNHCRAKDFRDRKRFLNAAFSLSLALEDVRDKVTLDIVDTPAAGFRHSPWSLG